MLGLEGRRYAVRIVRRRRVVLLALLAGATSAAAALALRDTGSTARRPSPPTIVAAGDIAACQPATERTAKLVARLNPRVVLTLGDNVYPRGTPDRFAACYEPTWGRFKAKTRPSAGNHDYTTDGRLAGFLRYFRLRRPYYAFNVGSWRLYALDSERVSAAQLAWLRRDIRRNRRRCVLAYWHRPRYSDGPHGDDSRTEPLWRAVAAARVDLVLTGHDHNYQRFPPIDGIRSFVVGTGGASLYDFTPRRPVASTDRTYGVLSMRLGRGGYAWSFVPVDRGAFRDDGKGRCR